MPKRYVIDSPSCEELAIHRTPEGPHYTCLTAPDRENSAAKIKKAAAVSANRLQYEQHAMRVFQRPLALLYRPRCRNLRSSLGLSNLRLISVWG